MGDTTGVSTEGFVWEPKIYYHEKSEVVTRFLDAMVKKSDGWVSEWRWAEAGTGKCIIHTNARYPHMSSTFTQLTKTQQIILGAIEPTHGFGLPLSYSPTRDALSFGLYEFWGRTGKWQVPTPVWDLLIPPVIMIKVEDIPLETAKNSRFLEGIAGTFQKVRLEGIDLDTIWAEANNDKTT